MAALATSALLARCRTGKMLPRLGEDKGQRVSLLQKGIKRAKNGFFCLRVHPLPQECGAEPVPLVLPAEKKPGWLVRRDMIYFPKACSDAGGCRKPT